MIPGDKAFYPGSDVLVNKYDIRDSEMAHAVEYKFASVRELELAVTPIEGNFDFKHLQAVHEHVFQDMYDWAGKVRQVDFAKRSKETGMVSRFTPISDIDKKAAEFNQFMSENNQLKGLTKPEFVKAFSEVHTKLNEIHPFREGNGRSTRIFLAQLAREAGYDLAIDKIDKDKWNLASHKAQPQHDPKKPGMVIPPSQAPIKEIFNVALKPTIEHAFEHEARGEALKIHPGLKVAYEGLDKITGHTDKLENREQANKLNAAAKTHIANKLRSHRAEREQSEAVNKLTDVRPGVRDKENVYGPRNDYEVIKATMSDVLTKQGYSPEVVAQAGQKVAAKMLLLKGQEPAKPANAPQPTLSRKDGPER